MSEDHVNHDHNQDSLYYGSRYQVKFYTDEGIIFTSTPMSGQKARDVITNLKNNFQGAQMTVISVEQAQELLLEHANLWEQKGVDLEDVLGPEHAGFIEEGNKAWEHAARLKNEAKELFDE